MKRIMFSVIFLVIFITGCTKEPLNEVVVYTSLDQIFSEPILNDFEAETGIRVKAVYDVEAAKTTGLVNRIIAEKNNPRCDVFWNSEIGRTIILKKKGLLSAYDSPSAKDIPQRFKDKDAFWTGFAARARVLVYNKNLVAEDELPDSIFELTKERWRGKVSLANPLFGTTAVHTAALYTELGEEGFRQYFEELKSNDVVIVDGNSTSRDRVVEGILEIGFTDTDDVNVALEEKKPIGMIFPDKEGIGTLFIPNTVCLIKRSPNPDNAKKFIDYLLSKEVETKLAFSGSLQIPLRADVKRPKNTPDSDDFKSMEADYEKIAGNMERSGKILQEILLR
ncbi:MAG: extracellular solute-binding protein [Omnitrophica bacterium]|nr:extracellular solute-binding protein [Candidatus Omnitrophota bacterium]